MIGLGPHYLAGVWRIEGLEVGIDCDTKKAKGADGPTSTDNGVKAADFNLVGHLNASHWLDFQRQIPDFSPRRPGRERAPLPIVHPLCAVSGITNVRVIKMKIDPPTSAGGMKVELNVQEWFDRPKETKKANKANTNVPAPPAQLVGIGGVLDHHDRRHGVKRDSAGNVVAFDDEVFPNPSDPDTAFQNAFSRGITGFGSAPPE